MKSFSLSVTCQRNALIAFSCVLLILVLASNKSSNFIRATSQCQVSLGSYRGPQYLSPESGTVGSSKCLVESKWLKLSQHSVRFPGSDVTFDDWMWIDYYDRINVLVEAERREGEERRFYVFRQSKYALEGRISNAIIGGVIEPGEEPEQAARREVDEEMKGLQCQNFHKLGRYRTDVNRGVGWLHSFLATNCSRDPQHHEHQALKDEIGVADTEKQELKTIALSELRASARKGEFLEVQWTATVALALLHPELME